MGENAVGAMSCLRPQSREGGLAKKEEAMAQRCEEYGNAERGLVENQEVDEIAIATRTSCASASCVQGTQEHLWLMFP